MALGLTRQLPDQPDVIAPDGSEVRLLRAAAGGSMAHFRLPAGETSHAVSHQTVEEIWFILSGKGEMWQSDGASEDVIALRPGLSLTIPVGTAFQFRAGKEALAAIAVTMPPWPGPDEAEPAEGPWAATVART